MISIEGEGSECHTFMNLINTNSPPALRLLGLYRYITMLDTLWHTEQIHVHATIALLNVKKRSCVNIVVWQQ